MIMSLRAKPPWMLCRGTSLASPQPQANHPPLTHHILRDPEELLKIVCLMVSNLFQQSIIFVQAHVGVSLVTPTIGQDIQLNLLLSKVETQDSQAIVTAHLPPLTEELPVTHASHAEETQILVHNQSILMG